MISSSGSRLQWLPFVLELALAAAAAVAGGLTAVSVFQKVDLMELTDVRAAALAWTIFACLAAFGAVACTRLRAEALAQYRRPALFLLIAGLGWSLLGLVRPSLRAGDGLVAQYYANTNRDGWPAKSAVDAVPSTEQMRRRWGDNAPAAFSVVWTGYLTVGDSGSYTFATTSDDGSRLYIGDRLVVDNGGEHGSRTRSGRINLPRGSHRVRLEYVELGAGSELAWSWAPGGGRLRTVQPWALSRRGTTYATVVAARAVEMALAVLAVSLALGTAWYLWTALRGTASRRIASEIRQVYPDMASLVFSACALVVIMFVRWPAGGLGAAVEAAFRDLNRTAFSALQDPASFHANISRPGAGEYVVGATVEEMLALLRRHDVTTYQISDGLAANDWVAQQIVASAWPRRREAGATARFVSNTELAGSPCTVIEQRTEVSLVHCP